MARPAPPGVRGRHPPGRTRGVLLLAWPRQVSERGRRRWWLRGVSLMKPWDLVLLILGVLIVLVALQTLWAMIL